MRFPSPCGVWVVSAKIVQSTEAMAVFPSPCGVWVVSYGPTAAKKSMPFPSPCGVWVVSQKKQIPLEIHEFPSPCGVWVVSGSTMDINKFIDVSVPLRGVGCFRTSPRKDFNQRVSVPLRGVGCFYLDRPFNCMRLRFPSPCGVWVVSQKKQIPLEIHEFPSPCGVWVVSDDGRSKHKKQKGFRPLAGCGLFLNHN